MCWTRYFPDRVRPTRTQPASAGFLFGDRFSHRDGVTARQGDAGLTPRGGLFRRRRLPQQCEWPEEHGSRWSEQQGRRLRQSRCRFCRQRKLDGCFAWGDASTTNEVRCDEQNRFVVRATNGISMFTGGSTQAVDQCILEPTVIHSMGLNAATRL